MENFKRSLKRLLTRLSILGLVVICGAIAIAQVQKQNNANVANAADTGSEPVSALSFGDSDSTNSQLREQSVNSLVARQAPERWDESTPVEPVKPAGGARFVEDPNVVPIQATEDLGDFDTPFPTAGADAGPPEFEPPNFDDAPELIGESDAPPLADGPSAPNSREFETGFPADDFGGNDAFPPAAETAPSAIPDATSAGSQPRTRFGGADDFSADPPAPAHPLRGNPQGNQLREPATNRFGAGEQMRPAEVPAATPPQRAVAEQPGPIAAPPVEAEYSFGGTGSPAVGEVGAALGENSVSLSGNGRPVPELVGPQSASLTVHKMPPAQLRVGEPAKFTVKVRNNGTVAAERVIIRDQVPKGTRLVDTTPPAQPESGGGIYWEIGTLPPNKDVTVSMQVIPDEEGLVGSVAVVSFETMASAQVEARRPMLKISHTTAAEVLAGETVRFAIVLDNPGSGTAKDVIIEEDVPDGLSHSKGPRLEHKVGDIPAAGQRRLELSLKAAKPGPVTNVIRARGANGLIAEHTVNLQVIAPELKVRIEGPSTRYLERPATYTVRLENHGTASAKNVDLVVQLPQGLKFVSTESNGRYDPGAHTVRWLLRDLPAGEFAPVKLTVNPNQKGQFKLNAVATADRGLRDMQDHSLSVDGIVALLIEVADQVDPIEVGGVTTYSIQVTNQGTKAATDVQFVALVPPGMSAVESGGVSQYQIRENGEIHFEPIARLAAKEKSSYLIRVKGVQAGDQRFKVKMTSADTPKPVIEEESTRVYADQ